MDFIILDSSTAFLSYSTIAFSEAKLTFAFETPLNFFSDFSIVAAQEAQCMPFIGRMHLALLTLSFSSLFFSLFFNSILGLSFLLLIFSNGFFSNVFLFNGSFDAVSFSLNLSWQFLLQKKYFLPLLAMLNLAV